MHTTRLKRKLNDLGVDTASSKANENFCLIGTPLPPLEKSKDTGEFVPLWKQEVKDEKGRRRLHGAFTGGFSAGYFNSVGSKEGWAPSTFKSSRTERAKAKAARPEDFMDEEDMSEFRDSQKLVDTTDEMDVDFWERGRKKGMEDEGEDSITTALQSALLPAPVDSVGARILKKMGWRPGHGIGPKLTYEQRRKQDIRASAPLGTSDDLAPDDHEEAKKHLYPQRDTKVPVFRKKEDSHGLGYVPGLSLNDTLAVESGSKSGPNISAGFGLGALNDADEDDLDVYDAGPGRSSRRIAYDDEDDDDRITIGSRSGGNRPRSSQTSKVKSEPDIEEKRSRFNDGTPVLPGFVISDKPVIQSIWFPLPKVPEDWTPNPRRVWEQDKENLKDVSKERDDVAAKPAQGAWSKSMTAGQRGNLLGETSLNTTPRSVFDYLAPRDRDRLKNLASGGVDIPTAPAPGPSASEQEPSVPRLDPHVAKMALQGFQPFTADPVKQARYTAFLQAQAAGEDLIPFGRTPGQSAETFAKELEDYAKSAAVFKPASAAMAGRFTSAAVIEGGPKVVEGLHQPERGSSESYLSRPSADKVEEPKKEESPKENAARMGMYGPLTREVKSWMPARLLCKRFGVKEPEIEQPPPQADSRTTSSTMPGGGFESGGVLAITDGSVGSTQINDGKLPGSSGLDGSTKGKRDLANVGLGEDETQGQDILTYEKPARDIFKAIFASDEEDEGDEEEVSSSERKDIPLASSSKLPSETAVAGDISRLPTSEAVYEGNGNSVDQAHAVDLASFKPTFVPRTERQRDKEKNKAEKKHKDKKRKGKVLVSFEVEEDGEGGPDVKFQDKDKDKEKGREKRKKKRNEETLKGEDDESMWFEKPPPEIVHSLVIPPMSMLLPETSKPADKAQEIGPPRGRKRAVDFM